MSNFIVLDVVIGLVFIYLLYSLLATIIQEMLATWFSFRSKLLERAIYRMLEDDSDFDKRFSSLKALFKRQDDSNSASISSNSGLFYNHPLVKYLGEDKYNSKPSYLTKETFAKVLIDLLRGDNLKPGDEVRPLIQQSLDVGKMAMSEFKIGEETLKYLKSIWIDAQGDVEVFRKSLENWFDQTMERCTGWYKKHVQYVLFIIGLFIAIAFNVDSISIAGKLQKDPVLRATVVQQADAYIKEHPKLYKDTVINLNKIVIDTSKQDILTGTANADFSAKAKNDSIFNRGIQLTHKADSLINGDIAKANGLLGLGWSGLKLTNSISCTGNTNDKKISDSITTNTNDKKISKSITAITNDKKISESITGKEKGKEILTRNLCWCCLSVAGKCLLMFLGWLITALALSLGAPFWFDLLNKLMKLRSSISIPTTSQTKTKEGDPISGIKRNG